VSNKNYGLKNFLAAIAGILCIIQGILYFVNQNKWVLDSAPSGIISIILGLVIILISKSYISGIVALIFCILSFIFGSWWGGICLLIVFIISIFD
jgi:hypothetical protein